MLTPYSVISAVAAIGLSTILGCASITPQQIQEEVAYLHLDVHDAALLVDDPKVVAQLASAEAALSQVNIALEAYIAQGDAGSKQGVIDAIEGAIAVVEVIAADDLPDEAKVALFLVKSSLRRWSGSIADAPTE
jgi:hypothetical protein